MAYNLQTLITILERILNPPKKQWLLAHDRQQLKALGKIAFSLQKILDTCSVPRIKTLESRIRDAAHRAEDVIEVQMADQLLSSGLMFTFSTPVLQEVTQELESAMAQVAEEMNMSTDSGNANSFTGVSSSPSPHLRSKSTVVVGVDADLMRLKDRLIGTKSKLEIIPIVGMGGVGKTTLARKLYEDPLILSHFKILAWTTISQDYNMKAIMLGLLRCIIGNETDQHAKKESDELRDIMYQSLYGRKYMIVLDDVWSTGFWDVVRKYFPDNSNGSRIVVTTRELNVAKYADSKSPHHEVQLLSASESWNLLRQIIFGKEDCPTVLQGIGTKIAGDCGGLPLAINVIGGLLSKIERSRDVWENIGNDVKVAIAESDKQFSQILYLSYNHLPNHLKPCFLYMGAFPEDYEIKISKLICLWVAEGFVKSNRDKSLEEEAEDYFKALVERNLFFVRDYSFDGKSKRCSMHDLLRDLCMKKADEENFLHIRNDHMISCSNMRRVSVATSYGLLKDVSASAEFIPLSRSFLYTGAMSSEIKLESLAFFVLRLLRVLDVFEIDFKQFPKKILQLVNLRYLALTCYALPDGISKLCNLRTLFFKLRFKTVPSELLEMPELRHIIINRAIRMDDDYRKRVALKKLVKIKYVAVDQSVIRRGLFENIPNIKDLGIYFARESVSDDAVDLSRLYKLETLRCNFGQYSRGCLSTVTYPCMLRKLTLSRCVISRGVLSTLCALSKLEVLKLWRCDFESEGETYEVWEAAEEDVFLSLQCLKLEWLHVECWRADETNFPRLRHLLIHYCRWLEEIPSGIGEISALQSIELYGCLDSLEASAKEIQEVQQSELGDYSLQLRISQ